jgi:creatinine amidohydrolase
MPLELVQLSSLQLSSLPKEKCVFFFPVAPLEDHGPHLPIGLDLEEAVQFCRLAAQHLEEEMPGWVGVIMPSAPLGLESNTTRVALVVRPYVLRDWLVDSCQFLMRNGFFHFVCFSGHLGPRQLTAIEDASSIVRNSARKQRMKNLFSRLSSPLPTLISASSALTSVRDALRSPFWPDPEEHGGRKDTSKALALVQEFVQPTYKHLPNLEKDPSKWKRNWLRRSQNLSGYWGDPSQANAESGERELLETLDELFPKMRAVWEGANPAWKFRSWYSILPPNKSFFKSWILIVMVSVLLSTWAYLAWFGVQFD